MASALVAGPGRVAAGMKGCREVAIELGLKVDNVGFFLPTECCESCHEDAAEGYEGLIWYDDNTLVCCAILRLLPEEGELND